MQHGRQISWLGDHEGSALANQIPATVWTHARGMHRPSGHVATFTGSVCFRRAVHRQRHLAAQKDVRGLFHVRVIGVVCVWPVFPNVSIAKAFMTQFLRQRLLVHAAILPNLGH
jgi:hypothetical protein